MGRGEGAVNSLIQGVFFMWTQARIKMSVNAIVTGVSTSTESSKESFQTLEDLGLNQMM